MRVGRVPSFEKKAEKEERKRKGREEKAEKV